MKFKVGDIIKGKELSLDESYLITNEYSLCMVTRIIKGYNKDDIEVKLLNHSNKENNNYIGNSFIVISDRFILIKDTKEDKNDRI